MAGMTAGVRRATVADVAALVGLRGLMLDAMGQDVGGPDAPWRAAAAAWFGDRLADTASTDFAVFVVDDPGLGVVSCAAGSCDSHAPGASNLTGRRGHVFNMSTDPRHRRRGYARACLVALLAWFDTEAGVGAIDLNATGDGVDLYTSLGFAPPRWPALQRRLTGRPAPVAPPAGR
jgi:GNAT superfamily N-acetyltransferase